VCLERYVSEDFDLLELVQGIDSQVLSLLGENQYKDALVHFDFLVSNVNQGYYRFLGGQLLIVQPWFEFFVLHA
jgi:hypothetical protein